MIIQLSEEDLKEIDRIAHLRNDTKKPSWNRRYCRKTNDFDMNVIGLKGEVAISKVFDSSVDDTVKLSGDNGLDFTVNGQTIQVKATKYRGGALYFNSLNHFKTDYAVLTYPFTEGGNNFVEIAGFISKSDFTEKFHTVNFGYGDRCAVDKVGLSDIKNLALKLKVK